MIVAEVDISIYTDKKGRMYFDTKLLDLDKESLVVPLHFDNVIGTVEFFRRKVTHHPPNDKSFTMTVEQYLNSIREGEED